MAAAKAPATAAQAAAPIDPSAPFPLGKAPIPADPAQHTTSPVAAPPLLVHLADLSPQEHFVQLYERFQELLNEASNGAMHERLQQMVVHGRLLIQAAQDTYADAKAVVEEAVAAAEKK